MCPGLPIPAAVGRGDDGRKRDWRTTMDAQTHENVLAAEMAEDEYEHEKILEGALEQLDPA